MLRTVTLEMCYDCALIPAGATGNAWEKPVSRTQRHYAITYWRPEIALEELQADEPLRGVRPNGKLITSPGNVIFICTVVRHRRELLLLGRLTVDRITQLPRYGYYLHARLPYANLKRIDLMPLAQHLRFDTSVRRHQLEIDEKGRADPSQFCAPRRVTPESAVWLEAVWAATPDLAGLGVEREDLIGQLKREVGADTEIRIEEEVAGASYGDPETNCEVEQRAIAYVRKIYEDDGFQVTSRERERVGYDLDCRRRLAPGQEELAHCEVKGIQSARESFEMTAKEMDHARRDPYFRLWVVTKALSTEPHGKMYSPEGFRESFRVAPSKYRVTLK